MRLLLAFRWAGNVRELINALRFASIRCGEGEEILPAHLPAEVQQASAGAPLPEAPVSAVPQPAPAQPPPHRKDKLTPETVGRALSDAGGNKALAAKLLNVSRATLYRFLERNPLS
jgi:transcriptional regulator of acetoin/glycerol metabolism